MLWIFDRIFQTIFITLSPFRPKFIIDYLVTLKTSYYLVGTEVEGERSIKCVCMYVDR